jgi:hypothetical protein
MSCVPDAALQDMHMVTEVLLMMTDARSRDAATTGGPMQIVSAL